MEKNRETNWAVITPIYDCPVFPEKCPKNKKASLLDMRRNPLCETPIHTLKMENCKTSEELAKWLLDKAEKDEMLMEALWEIYRYFENLL